MKTETEIRSAGMNALIDALGTVEAERFIASVSRDSFDYTEWRRSGLPDLTLEQLSEQAMRTAVQFNMSLTAIEPPPVSPSGKS
ncbi:MAG: hypothetical protein WA210_24410 [Burkholderiaceae bacterium]